MSSREETRLLTLLSSLSLVVAVGTTLDEKLDSPRPAVVPPAFGVPMNSGLFYFY